MTNIRKEVIIIISARDKIIDGGYEEDIVIFTNQDYDSALIGISEDNRAVYDYDKMVEHLVKYENMSEIDAIEQIEYNTIRSMPYIENETGCCPIIVHML